MFTYPSQYQVWVSLLFSFGLAGNNNNPSYEEEQDPDSNYTYYYGTVEGENPVGGFHEASGGSEELVVKWEDLKNDRASADYRLGLDIPNTLILSFPTSSTIIRVSELVIESY